MIKLTVNGISHTADADPDTPLLWVIREWLGMTGTNIGCGIAQYNVLHRAYRWRRDAILPGARELGGRCEDHHHRGPVARQSRPSSPRRLAPARRAAMRATVSPTRWLAAAALLKTNPKPSDDDIDSAITNICHCGTYRRIREAIHTAASLGGKASEAAP